HGVYHGYLPESGQGGNGRKSFCWHQWLHEDHGYGCGHGRADEILPEVKEPESSSERPGYDPVLPLRRADRRRAWRYRLCAVLPGNREFYLFRFGSNPGPEQLLWYGCDKQWPDR